MTIPSTFLAVARAAYRHVIENKHRVKAFPGEVIDPALTPALEIGFRCQQCGFVSSTLYRVINAEFHVICNAYPLEDRLKVCDQVVAEMGMLTESSESWGVLPELLADQPTLSNEALADELITRLNGVLTSDPEVRTDISRLVETRIAVSETTGSHPTIQVSTPGLWLGFTGLLNGIVGTVPEGRFQGWGFIAAKYDDDEKLVKFVRTDKGPKP